MARTPAEHPDPGYADLRAKADARNALAIQENEARRSRDQEREATKLARLQEKASETPAPTSGRASRPVKAGKKGKKGSTTPAGASPSTGD